jgi:hypothetical protein
VGVLDPAGVLPGVEDVEIRGTEDLGLHPRLSNCGPLALEEPVMAAFPLVKLQFMHNNFDG